MKNVLFVFLIFCFSLTFISCAEKDEHSIFDVAPSAPSGLTATGGAIQVKLNWTASPGASSYNVYWDDATGVSSSSTAITGISTDYYTHSGLEIDKTYYYKVAPVNSYGTGSLTSEVNATTNRYVSTNTIASGSITVGSNTLSGIYGSECLTSASIISYYKYIGYWPSEVIAYGHVFVVTASDSISVELHSFTDTSCSLSSVITKTLSNNVTVGSASGSNYPVTYNNRTQKLTVNSTAAETTLEALLNSTDFTVGTEKELSMTGEIRYGLWTLSGTTLYLADDSKFIAPTSAGTVPLR